MAPSGEPLVIAPFLRLEPVSYTHLDVYKRQAVMFHGIQGVREGTIAAAVVVGMIARFFLRKLGFMENMLRTVKKEADKKEKITVG